MVVLPVYRTRWREVMRGGFREAAAASLLLSGSLQGGCF